MSSILGWQGMENNTETTERQQGHPHNLTQLSHLDETLHSTGEN